jgi:leukotriene-A4 hydrolase
LGTPLVIQLDKKEFKLNEELVLRIKYSTTKDSEGVQWLNSNQTNLKQYPFMFTQSEPILGRTLFPCQVKFII